MRRPILSLDKWNRVRFGEDKKTIIPPKWSLTFDVENGEMVFEAEYKKVYSDGRRYKHPKKPVRRHYEFPDAVAAQMNERNLKRSR